MGMMGMFKWLRKDMHRDRNGWNLAQKQSGLNNESYRNALQAFIDRRRFSDDLERPSSRVTCANKRADLFSKNNNNESNRGNQEPNQKTPIVPGVPHILASEIFEIGWVAGTEDRYIELIFAEWQNTRVSLKRHTHPECKDAVKNDLDVLSEIRHPNVLLLMATTHTDDHGLVSVFESVDCTLYNYLHEQGERISIQCIAKCAGRLSDALRHSHMRGYVHGAISSHCVYLASSGVVKLGGWELATHIENRKPHREYEERLRTEIFRWQAPEIFQGYQPSKQTDVYGLTLLIWEMCTMRIPWSGHNRADVERQYVHWRRGLIMDLYDFPPLLNNLLEAGLQLDINNRTLDMNRMRRFLQRLEMQYEDEQPVFIDQLVNNNNESYLVPIVRYPNAGLSNGKPARLTKSASAKQLSRPTKNSDFYSNIAEKAKRNEQSKPFEQINFFDAKDEMQKTTNILYDMKNNRNYSSLEELEKNQDVDKTSLSNVLPAPWNSTYRKVAMHKDIQSLTSLTRNSNSPLDSTDDESFKDARTNLRQLKRVLADRREHFFYGSDTSSYISLDTNPETRLKIFTQARVKDYEPHKPASHKTSFEPKCNKSPGQYDSSYMKPSFSHYRRVPYSSSCIKDAIMQQKVLNSNSQSFFENSLWRKEKLICLSKMRKTYEDDDPSQYYFTQRNDSVDLTTNQFEDSPKTDETYIINNRSKFNIETTSATCDTDTNRQHWAENPMNKNKSPDRESEPLQVLRDALDRATKIVHSATPKTNESFTSPPFKTYKTFEVTVEDAHLRKSIFEDLYDLRADDNDEIKTIERASTSETDLVDRNIFNDTITREEITNEFANKSSSILNITNYDKPNTNLTTDATHARTFVCESIAEVSSELNSSSNDTPNNKPESGSDNETLLKENSSEQRQINDRTLDGNEEQTKPVQSNYTLMLLNDSSKYKNCKSCHQSALPRRRSLPAALSQLRGINSSALGKLPIRRANMPDSTVEDLYIDDEFGDSLNVNMILLDEDLSIDEDFLPDLSEL